VRLALAAQHHLNSGGSITLTSGIVSAQPIRDGVNATSVNAALEGFVRRTGAAAARPAHQRGQPERTDRIDGGLRPLPGLRGGKRSARRWPSSAVEGIQSGETITVW
jgi:hypothetical protein